MYQGPFVLLCFDILLDVQKTMSKKLALVVSSVLKRMLDALMFQCNLLWKDIMNYVFFKSFCKWKSIKLFHVTSNYFLMTYIENESTNKPIILQTIIVTIHDSFLRSARTFFFFPFKIVEKLKTHYFFASNIFCELNF